jgi:adenine phosphoribosyltransferase
LDVERLKSLVRDVPDFPKPGIVFKDLTPLLADGAAFGQVVDALAAHFRDRRPTKVLGIEARGFILAAPVAHVLRAGFVPARKRGKLPWDVRGVDYELEYGAERLELHSDAVGPSDRVLIVDDVLATGGTVRAAVSVVGELGAEVVGAGVVLELSFLHGRERLADLDVEALITL